MCALLAGVGLWRAARHARHREPAPAALVIGCLSLALSPISWPHHQAWVVLAALWIAIVGPWGFRLLGMLIIASYALGSPLWDQPQDSGLAWRVAGEIPTAIIVALTIFGLPRSRRP